MIDEAVQNDEDFTDTTPDEIALLSALLVDQDRVEDVVTEIEPGDFFDPLNRQLFLALREASEKGYRVAVSQAVGALGGDAKAIHPGMGITIGQFIAKLYVNDAALDKEETIRIAQVIRHLAQQRREEPGFTDKPDPQFESQMGLLMWDEQDVPGEEYEFIIDGLIPKGESVLIYGESQSGKTFLSFDMGMSLALGRPFFGHKVLRPMGVIYCAYEAGRGFKNRMRAYRKTHPDTPLSGVPFAALTAPAELWTNELNIRKLANECRQIAADKFPEVELGAIIIDTHNAATPGASEVNSEDVSKIRSRYRQLMELTGAGVWIVSHKNAQGQMRGNLQLYNNIETAIDVSRKVKVEGRETHPVYDRGDPPRQVRTFRVQKQREGMDGEAWDFVLPAVEIGVTAYGKPRTSCVVTAPEWREDGAPPTGNLTATRRTPAGWYQLNDRNRLLYKTLVEAIKRHGSPAPADIRAPAGARVVKWSDWKNEAVRSLKGEEGERADDATLENRAKAAIARAKTQWEGKIIGHDAGHYWRTGRKVVGVDQADAPLLDEADAGAGRDIPVDWDDMK